MAKWMAKPKSTWHTWLMELKLILGGGINIYFGNLKKKFHANLKNQLILAKNSQNGKMDGKAQKYMAHVAYGAEINFGRGYQHIFWKFKKIPCQPQKSADSM